jgi:hypothetical protein
MLKADAVGSILLWFKTLLVMVSAVAAACGTCAWFMVCIWQLLMAIRIDVSP